MRYVAQLLITGFEGIGAADHGAWFRWAVARIYLLCGVAVFAVGLVFFPLPIPLGIPLMSLGIVIILNTSITAKKVFARWSRRHPDTVGRIRGVIRARRRAAYRRRTAAAKA